MNITIPDKIYDELNSYIDIAVKDCQNSKPYGIHGPLYSYDLGFLEGLTKALNLIIGQEQ